MPFGQKYTFLGGTDLIRSGPLTQGVNPTIAGAQDFTNASAPAQLGYGIGQDAGSFTGVRVDSTLLPALITVVGCACFA